MIYRLFFEQNLTFKRVQLDFSPGLNVISGCSGAGKSVIFKSILSAFAMEPASAQTLSVETSLALSDESLQSEKINIFAAIKNKSTRHFYNHQSVSKRLLEGQMREKIIHLGANDAPEIQPAKLLDALDAICAQENAKFSQIFSDFKAAYAQLAALKTELEQLEANEANAAAMVEFLEFEVGKLEAAALQIGEYDELMAQKSRLARADKLAAAIEQASGVFDYTHKVSAALKLAGRSDEGFLNAMAELEDEFFAMQKADEGANIEQVLNRLEVVGKMVKKYGSEEAALEALAAKKAELEKLSDVEFNKSKLNKLITKQNEQTLQIAERLHELRSLAAKRLSAKMSDYLSSLYLRDLSIFVNKTTLKNSGCSEVEILLGAAGLKNISSGELNRLRLAFLAATAALAKSGGVMFLDEIDANLSGKEAISIAKVISKLSASYQIFVITHLPWLCAQANCHILVERSGEQSSAKVLKDGEKVKELARMIGDESINESAMEFAKTLLNKKDAE